MIYRCNLQHFLVHAVDHFSLTDLTEMQYAIISSKISNGSRARNVVKVNQLYPDVDTVMAYEEYKDDKILEKMYIAMLKDKEASKESESNPYSNVIYKTFINPLMEHYNIMIMCDEKEDKYIDILCKYLKNEFEIEVIDLNVLFTKGRVGPIYIDRDEIHDKAVDIRRAALKEQVRNMATTRDGKEMLIAKMSKKEKIKQLKKYGVKIKEHEMKDINSILLDEWCAADEEKNGYEED